jgi:hypothetical protein
MKTYLWPTFFHVGDGLSADAICDQGESTYPVRVALAHTIAEVREAAPFEMCLSLSPLTPHGHP